MTAATLDQALAGAERVLLDTSALIAFHSRAEAGHPLARQLLARIEASDDPLRGCLSVVSAAELLVRPHRTGVEQFTHMHTFLTQFPNLTVLPMDVVVAAQAAAIRSTTGLRLPDAIVVASGLLSGCEAIVSNDEAWGRKLQPMSPAFRWVYLGAHA